MYGVSPRKFQRLPRQTVWVDNRGRVTIPAYMLKAAGIEKESWIEVLAEPDLENAKGLLVTRS